MRIPAILDIEASGFGRGSYPIEIGVALPDRSVISYLVTPEPDWTHWSQDAQALHGLTRERLLAEGCKPAAVAEQLNRVLEGQVVYSDGWGVDSGWLALLYYYAGVKQAFQLETLVRIMTQAQASQWHATLDELSRAGGQARHRAGRDARLLQETFLTTRERLRRQSIQSTGF